PHPPTAAATILGGKFYAVNGLPNRAPDAIIEGKPIKELAKLCLEPSDNSIAEHLLLMAAAKQGELGSNEFDTATTRMSKFYTEVVKIPDGQIRPVDGSGLSRH